MTRASSGFVVQRRDVCLGLVGRAADADHTQPSALIVVENRQAFKSLPESDLNTRLTPPSGIWCQSHIWLQRGN